ncbi:MAG: molybdopterin cofactor-binding domain-containing protein [Bacillota bacterium]
MSCEIPVNGVVGKSMPIRDAALKATGQLKYVADMKFSGMLHAKVLFSPVAHARIKRIDTSKAEAVEGVFAVISYQNTPDVYFNSCGETIELYKTERLFDEIVRFVGDKVAAVAAVDERTAEKALKLIEVEYEELPANFDPEQGAQDDSYVIHTHGGLEKGNIIETVLQSCGDVDEGMQNADMVLEDVYTFPAIHHGAIETHASISVFDASGKLTVYTASQDTFAVRINLSRIFGLPMSKVRVLVPAMGGAFGGKIDLSTEHVSAALAIKTGRPVRLVFNRREDIVSTRTRHAMRIYMKTGVMKDGTIVSEDMRVYCNAGAYASGTTNIVWAMCGKLFKVHKCKNVRFTGFPVITNSPVGGPMRGFGSPQTFFAQQRQMNRIANALKMDLLELQRKNLTLPDGIDYRFDLPHGNARPLDCLERAVELIGYEQAKAEQEATKNGRYRIGVGIGVGAHGNGMYGVRTDITGHMLKMNDDGSCVLFSGTHEMGNAAITTQVQMVSEVLGIGMDRIECISADTEATPYQLGDYSSRGTFVSAHGAVRVAQKMRELLVKYAAELLETEEDGLTLRDNQAFAPDGRSVTMEQVVQCARHKHFTELMCTNTYAAEAAVISYGAHIAKVRVDMETGKTELLDYVAVHDVGKAINPMGVHGQIEGAIQMGAGYALSEGIELDEKGKVKNMTLRTYHMFNSGEMPKRIQVDLIEKLEQAGPYGAKSIGECSVVPSISAIGNAVSNATGLNCNDLPLNPQRLLALMQKQNA